MAPKTQHPALTLSILVGLPLVSIVASAQSQQPAPIAPKPSEPPQAKADQRGTKEVPLVVQILPLPVTEKEAADIAAYHKDKKRADRWLIGITAVLAGAAILQWIVLWIQSRLLRQSIRTQTTDMGRTIAESARAAGAMEAAAASLATQVSTTTTMAHTQREFWQRQMRAYIGVLQGAIFEQNTSPGSRFECQPFIQNDGLTPAYDVVYRSFTTLLQHPLPQDFDFTLPDPPSQSRGTLNPRANMFMINVADRLYTDAEYNELKQSGGRRLYTYGNITYRDISGDVRHTNFCFYFVWGNQGRPVYMRADRHNEST